MCMTEIEARKELVALAKDDKRIRAEEYEALQKAIFALEEIQEYRAISIVEEKNVETEKMIRELRRLEEKHKNDKVLTFDNNWSLMCHDVANRLEEQEKEIESLRFQIEALKIGGIPIELQA